MRLLTTEEVGAEYKRIARLRHIIISANQSIVSIKSFMLAQ